MHKWCGGGTSCRRSLRNSPGNSAHVRNIFDMKRCSTVDDMKLKIDYSRTEYLAETSRVMTVGTFKHLLCCVGGLQKNPHQVVCVSFLAQGSFQSCDTPTFTSPSTIPVSAQAARPVAAPGRRAELCLLSFVFLVLFWPPLLGFLSSPFLGSSPSSGFPPSPSLG